MKDLTDLFSAFCSENNLEVRLSYNMPDGYETAYGTFDVTIKTLFFNRNLLETAPKHEVLFYLYHELRHAMQYLHPHQFDKLIQESRFYVVLYNGICFKLVGNDWQECRLVGEEDYFTEAYLSLPYEIDANAFAYEKVKELCGDSKRLQGLYGYCMPQKRWSYTELKALFERIDESLSESLQKGTTLIKTETTDAVKSVGVMKKLGMRFESVQESQVKDQCGVDLHFYSLLEEDWRNDMAKRTEEVELTNMCMICDGKGNVLVQDKKNHPTWHGWNFPGGHIEKEEYVTPSVIREIFEETGLTIENPKLCGIKEFHKRKDGKRYIVFLYIADQFSGELKASDEGKIFWYPLSELSKSDKLIDGFAEMLPVFTNDRISEIFYERNGDEFKTVFC